VGKPHSVTQSLTAQIAVIDDIAKAGQPANSPSGVRAEFEGGQTLNARRIPNEAADQDFDGDQL
jgi:hypothetical protein